MKLGISVGGLMQRRTLIEAMDLARNMSFLLCFLLFLVSVTIVRAAGFFDDFNDGNAKGWDEVMGDWEVVEGEYSSSEQKFQIKGKEIKGLTVAGEDWEDGTLTVKMKMIIPMGPGAWHGCVVWRYQDEQNYYRFCLDWRDKKWFADKLVGGTLTEFDRVEGPSDRLVWFNLKVVASGSEFTTYVDGKLMLTFSDNDLPKGRLGLYALERVRYDDVKLITPGAVEPSGKLATTWGRLKAEY